jgi:Leucine-rich repeat (LRR) protein
MLPQTISNLSSLQRLDLEYNNLTDLPSSFSQLDIFPNLKHNKFQQVPKALIHIFERIHGHKPEHYFDSILVSQ